MTAVRDLPRPLARLASRLGLTAYCERCDGSYDGAVALGWDRDSGVPFPYTPDVVLPHTRHAGSLTPYDLTHRLRRAWLDADPWPGDDPAVHRWVTEKRDPRITRLAVRLRRLALLAVGRAGQHTRWCCPHPYADHTPWACQHHDRTGHRCHGDPDNQQRAGLRAALGPPHDSAPPHPHHQEPL